jgi:hypothetical protein
MKKFFKTLWPALNTKEEISLALKNSVGLGYILIFSYSVTALYVFLYNQIPFSRDVITTNLEKIITIIFILIIIIIPFYLTRRIKSQKYNSIPVLALWTLIEYGTKVLSFNFGPGSLLISVVVMIYSISCLRVWGAYKFK